jgi:pimeloyl-ACP methyl ester carboxylesterase
MQRLPLLLALLAAAASAQPAALEPIEFELEGGETVAAEQGEVWVPENRSDPDSRRIAVRFVRFASRAEAPGPPVFYLAGGPGGAGTDAARGRRWALFSRLRDDADVVVLDQRGTGLSERVPGCTSSVAVPPDSATTRTLVTRLYGEALAECLGFWEGEGVDARGWTTWESAADVDAVREALGAERVSLLGISYGTHLALAVLRRFPDRVDRLVLASAEGPDETVKLPARTDAYVARLQAAVDRDSAAAARYPDVAGLVRRVLDRIEADPPRDTLRQRDGTPFVRTLGRFQAQQISGYLISDPDRAAGLLDAYAAADRGDVSFFTRFSGWVLGPTVALQGMPELMDLASGVSPGRLAAVEAEAPTALLGDALNFPMPHLAGAVAGLELPDSFREPVVSDRPALFLSGTLDGRTYPEAHAEAAAGFPNGAVVTVENAGHNLFFSHPDLVEIVAHFLAGAPAEARTLVAPLPTLTDG